RVPGYDKLSFKCGEPGPHVLKHNVQQCELNIAYPHHPATPLFVVESLGERHDSGRTYRLSRPEIAHIQQHGSIRIGVGVKSVVATFEVQAGHCKSPHNILLLETCGPSTVTYDTRYL